MSDHSFSVPDRRLEEIAKAVSARLRPVCAHMSEAEFQAMVARIALRERKWERGGSYKPPRGPGTSRQLEA